MLGNEVHDLLWATESWALKNTGSGLYEASDKQVGFILSLIKGVPDHQKSALVQICGTFGLSYPLADSLTKLSSYNASKLIDALKGIAKPTLSGPVTLKQVGFIKSLLAKVDPHHGDVISLLHDNGVKYTLSEPGPAESELHKLTKDQASKIIDGLSSMGKQSKYKPVPPSQEKSTEGQIRLIAKLRLTLWNDFHWDEEQFLVFDEMVAKPSSASSQWTQEYAAKHIAALQQALEQEKAKVKAVVYASTAQKHCIKLMATALDFPPGICGLLGLKKYNVDKVLDQMPADEADQLMHQLTALMVTSEQLHKLHALYDKITTHHPTALSQMSSTFAIFAAGMDPLPSHWGFIESGLKLRLPKKSADQLIHELSKIASPKAATSQQVSQVLALLNQLGAAKVKKNLGELGVKMDQLRTDHLKKMGANEIEELIAKLSKVFWFHYD